MLKTIIEKIIMMNHWIINRHEDSQIRDPLDNSVL